MQVTQQTAVKKSVNKDDISSRHITTLGVNDIRVTNIIECRQGDKIVCDLSQFHRFSPLVVPTYGSFKINTYAFFVPMMSIWHHFGEFMDNSSDTSFSSIKDPINFSLEDFMSFFVTDFSNPAVNYRSKYMTYDATAQNPDLIFAKYASDTDTTPTTASFILTSAGRLLWNQLQSLGYGFPRYIPYSVASGTNKYKTYFQAKDYSVFPLLALARVFYDYLYPSAYVTQQGFGWIFTDSLWENFISSSTPVADLLQVVMDLLVNCYDRDFYTSLWSRPNQVASTGNLSSFSPVYQYTNSGNNSLIAQSSSGTSGTIDDARISQSAASFTNTISATTLRWLESISDFCMRNNIGGSRVREYFRSNYGFVPSDMKDDISQYIKCFPSSVQIQDVTSTSPGSSVSDVLGQQAGKASANGKQTLKFESRTWGYLIFLTSVVPSIGYVQGQNPVTRSINSRFDLYNSQFDGIGMEAIPRRSVFSQYRDANDLAKVDVSSLNDVFGYAPMYSERYKVRHDMLSGDFLFNSRNRGLDSYHTFRDVLYGRSNLALDAQFMETDNQCQRIFAYTGSTGGTLYSQYDKIFSFFRFDVDRYSHSKSLSESLPMFDRSGQKQSVQYEGNQL